MQQCRSLSFRTELKIKTDLTRSDLASGTQVLSEIFKSLKITAATQFHKQHGSDAIQAFLTADEEASWSLLSC